MYATDIEIYQILASTIVNAIQEPGWNIAELEVFFNYKSNHIKLKSRYFTPATNKVNWFDPLVSGDPELDKLSAELFRIRKSKPEDKPFNKYKFTLNNDGTFDIEFKYDEDFAYMKSLDPDSEEFDELLELDVTDQIDSWEGLPKDHPRPWLEP